MQPRGSGHKGVFTRVGYNQTRSSVLVYEELKDGIEELWVHFGAEKNWKFVPIHKAFQCMGESRACGLPFFHAFTGCGQVSFLSHVTKHTAWKVWYPSGAASSLFNDLGQEPTLMQVQGAMSTIEKVMVLLYHRTSNCLNTNEWRRELFRQGRSISNIPPTSAAMWNHTL